MEKIVAAIAARIEMMAKQKEGTLAKITARATAPDAAILIMAGDIEDLSVALGKIEGEWSALIYAKKVIDHETADPKNTPESAKYNVMSWVARTAAAAPGLGIQGNPNYLTGYRKGLEWVADRLHYGL